MGRVQINCGRFDTGVGEKCPPTVSRNRDEFTIIFYPHETGGNRRDSPVPAPDVES